MASKNTPLRWMGSKSRMIGRLRKLVPNSFDYFIEPFAGSAEVSLTLIKEGWVKGSQVWINDKNFALIAFWQMLRDYPYELITALHEMYDEHFVGDNDLFQRACDEIEHPSDDKLRLAVYFYAMNTMIYAGKHPYLKKTEKGRLTGRWSHFCNPVKSGRGLRKPAIRKLLEYSVLLQGVKITCLDFSEITPPTENTFIFVDPPYRLGWRVELEYYGFIFHHRRFAKWCNQLKLKSRMLITYDVNDKHFTSFKGWETFKHNVFYSTAHKVYYELVFTNYDIPLPKAMGMDWKQLEATNDNTLPVSVPIVSHTVDVANDDRTPSLPAKKYEIIYADPPWGNQAA